MPTDQDLQIEALYRQGVPLKDIGEMMVPFERTSDLYRQVTAGLIDPEKLSNEQLKSLLAERKQVQAARGMQRDVTGFMRGAVPGMSWGTEPQETASEMVGMALNPLNVAGAALTRASFLPNAIKYSRLGRAVFGAAVGAAEFPAVTGDISDVKYGAALGAGVGAIGAIPKNPLQFLKEKAQLRLPPAAREAPPAVGGYGENLPAKIEDVSAPARAEGEYQAWQRGRMRESTQFQKDIEDVAYEELPTTTIESPIAKGVPATVNPRGQLKTISQIINERARTPGASVYADPALVVERAAGARRGVTRYISKEEATVISAEKQAAKEIAEAQKLSVTSRAKKMKEILARYKKQVGDVTNVLPGLVPLGVDKAGYNTYITANGVVWSVPGHGAGARY